MSNVIRIHSENPQKRLVKQVVEVLDKGHVIAYPTDSGYALAVSYTHLTLPTILLV